MLSSNTLATWCEQLTHWKRSWCWGRLRAGGEGDDRGWDGWMVSLTWCTWVWVSSGSWWQTGRPGVVQSMGSQRVGHDWVTELHWREFFTYIRLWILIIKYTVCLINISVNISMSYLPRFVTEIHLTTYSNTFAHLPFRTFTCVIPIALNVPSCLFFFF